MKATRRVTALGLLIASIFLILTLSSCGTNPVTPGNLNSQNDSNQGSVAPAAIDTLTVPAAIDTLTAPKAINTLAAPAIDTSTR